MLAQLPPLAGANWRVDPPVSIRSDDLIGAGRGRLVRFAMYKEQLARHLINPLDAASSSEAKSSPDPKHSTL